MTTVIDIMVNIVIIVYNIMIMILDDVINGYYYCFNNWVHDKKKKVTINIPITLCKITINNATKAVAKTENSDCAVDKKHIVRT